MRSTAASKLTLETLVPRDVLSALRAIGIDAEERGDEAVALCPHPDHNDRSPSWSCNLDDGRHHCFACGFGGSFTFLVTKMLGIPTPDAMQWVRERKIKDVAEGHVGPRQKRARVAASLSEADLWRFIEPPAEALAERGLTAEACRECDVRWDDERKLWITPVRDPFTGRLWGWQEKNARYFRNRPLDLPKSRALFGFQSLGQDRTAVLVESPLDVPYLRAAGIDGAVSGYGVSISSEQITLLRERASQVVLALDNDRAGWTGVSKLAYAFGTMDVRVFNYGRLLASGATRSVLEDTLDGTDPGNLSADELSWGVEHAVPAWRLRIPWLSR
jgi:DNA primase